MRTNIIIATAVLGLSISVSACRVEPTPTPPNTPGTSGGRNDGPAGERNAEGWEKLGERGVSGKVDRDNIFVGRGEGKFTALKIKVEDSAIEMFDVVVHFGDDTSFSPPTRMVFKAGETSNPIDLGGKRVIRSVDFKYGNLPGGKNAKIELWGK